MNKHFFAIIAVLVLSSPARSDEVSASPSKVDQVVEQGIDGELLDEVAQLPSVGEEQVRERSQAPGQVAQPSIQTSDQIETALGKLPEVESHDGSLTGALTDLKIAKLKERRLASEKRKQLIKQRKIAKNKMLRRGKSSETKTLQRTSEGKKDFLPRTLPKKQIVAYATANIRRDKIR